ncbi:hypothetical protein RF11_07477 [Thelohanellus kitauei]|uniref:Uncharacterized protein n=1 Tax=Thelohanellus kitauei TaxID=669202 RepID=A0A0C2MTX3_THEKT|nr:hypothetical protein RF11_07477 [Thelohanellus kitauei]
MNVILRNDYYGSGTSMFKLKHYRSKSHFHTNVSTIKESSLKKRSSISTIHNRWVIIYSSSSSFNISTRLTCSFWDVPCETSGSFRNPYNTGVPPLLLSILPFLELPRSPFKSLAPALDSSRNPSRLKARGNFDVGDSGAHEQVLYGLSLMRPNSTFGFALLAEGGNCAEMQNTATLKLELAQFKKVDLCFKSSKDLCGHPSAFEDLKMVCNYHEGKWAIKIRRRSCDLI